MSFPIDNVQPILHRSQDVLSSNIELRRDGLPYANRPEPDDPGVAVYFMYDGEPRVFCCDKWDRVQDNMHAIGNTIGAIRGMDRWGVSDMLPRIFRGFQALPDVGGTYRQRLVGYSGLSSTRWLRRDSSRLPRES